LISARHPSQLYQAAAEGVGVGLALWFVARRPRVPGIVGSWFLIAYGALRIVTEFWRLPDAHLAVGRIAGLSRGQWLSALMVVIGVFFLMTLWRSKEPKMGGWMHTASSG
jgi:phosphatidylglycerol:prolipoprotein diacylglycerol transferase